MTNKYIRAQKKAKKGLFESVITSTEKPSRTRHYDPDAPRFVYRRNASVFTRKSNKVRTDSELILNQVNTPSQKKREYAEHPKTKPMIGWERVYVGSGKWLQRGRKSKKYKNNLSNDIIIRPKKAKFIPFARTYKNNLRKNFNVLDSENYNKSQEKFVGKKVIKK